MTSQPTHDHADVWRHNHKGHTTVASRALMSVATMVTAETLGVDPRRVEVSVHDDNADLGLSLRTPIRLSDIHHCEQDASTTLFSLCDKAREEISERTSYITGHRIGEVHLVVDGIHSNEGRRLQ